VNVELIKLSFPILLSNWIYAFQSFVILLSVSGLGDEVIAGVGFASTLIWLLYGIDEAVYTGIAVLTTSRLREEERVGRFIVYGFILSVAVALPIYAFGQELLSSFLSLFGVKGRSLEAAVNFTEPVILLLPLVLTTNALNALFNGAGRTKEIFYGTLLVLIFNLILLPLLVPRLGEEGAGWSVALSESLASLYYLAVALKSKELNPLNDFRVAVKELLEVVRVGLPAGVEETVSSLSYNVFTGLVAVCGTKALAAFQVGLRVEGIAAAVGFSLLDAALPFIGQVKGELLRRRIKELIKTASLLGALVGALLLLFSYPSLYLFELDEEVKRLSLLYLSIAALSQPFFTLSCSLTGALRALRRTEVEAFINLSSFWLLRIAPSWLALKFIHSALIPWGAMGVESVIRSLLLLRAVKRYV